LERSVDPSIRICLPLILYDRTMCTVQCHEGSRNLFTSPKTHTGDRDDAAGGMARRRHGEPGNSSAGCDAPSASVQLGQTGWWHHCCSGPQIVVDFSRVVGCRGCPGWVGDEWGCDLRCVHQRYGRTDVGAYSSVVWLFGCLVACLDVAMPCVHVTMSVCLCPCLCVDVSV
jgi:hypothetical protein